MLLVQNSSDDMKVMLDMCCYTQRLLVPRTVTSRVTPLSQEDQRRLYSDEGGHTDAEVVENNRCVRTGRHHRGV